MMAFLLALAIVMSPLAFLAVIVLATIWRDR
jgi:hypothetical protein